MIFDRLLAPLSSSREQRSVSLENPSVSINDADAWSEAFGLGGQSDAGEAVTAHSALSLSGFWAAVKMISGDVSRLPLQTYRKQQDAKPTPDDSHYLMRRIGPQGVANDDTSAMKLWRRAMVQALIYENAYIWLDFDASARVAGLYLLLSDRTGVVRVGGRKWVVSEVGVGTGGERIMARPYSEVLHLEGLTLDNDAGCAALRQAREDIGCALASRKFKSKFFGQGMHAGGVLQVPPGASPKTREKIEHAVADQHTATKNAFRTLVLRDGFKYFSTQIHPEQAQLTEMDEAGVRDIARRFQISPSRLGVKDSFSYNSLAMDRRDYYDTTLAYWLSMNESELNTKALTEAEREQWYIGYAANLALLFADAQTLATIGFNGVNARDGEGRSVFQPDEVRSWFGLRPLPQQEEPAEEEDLEEEEPPEDPPADDEADGDGEPSDDSESREAHRQLLSAELLRIVRRLNVHSERAAKRSDATGDWMPWKLWAQGFDRDHAAASIDSLGPVVRACQASQLLTAEATAETIAERLFGGYRARLMQVQDRPLQAGASLAERATSALEQLDLASDLAAELIA